MKYVHAIILVLILGLAVEANAQSSPAKDLFAGKCAACHSADGTASTPIGKSLKIPSFLSADVQKQPDAELKDMIDKGKGGMPKFADKLTGPQVDQMVAYVRTLGKK
jgi:mono/diheme cytochrome c family protein